MVADLHPLSTQNKSLTSALNATLITFNGNELVLQNDMGNTKIQDAKTGNLITLSDGFIPVGMKEHGGVLYIASHNPQSGQSELGTIPSPVVEYTYLENPEEKNLGIDISDLDTENYNNDYKLHINSELIPLDETTKFRVGDQFLVLINASPIIDTTKQTSNNTTITYPLFTQVVGKSGWFKVKLYSKTVNGQVIDITNTVDKIQQNYYDGNKENQSSDYWFVLNETNGIDTELCGRHNLYRKYPNIPAGYLYISIEPEVPENIEMIENQTTRVKSPFVYIVP